LSGNLKEESARAGFSRDLIAKVAAGDEGALERLYDSYASTIYGLLLKITGDTEEASDLLQETFVQVWKNAGRYDPARGSETAWLITIARSRALDRLRSRKTRSERENEAGKEILQAVPSVDQESVSDLAELHQTRRILLSALEELPPEQRQVLELAYFQGQSHAEIAAALGQPLGSVKTRIALGMKKLKGRLVPLFRWNTQSTKI
jgi:RNA polymerase sigma-70 factor (ECF subfamily)